MTQTKEQKENLDNLAKDLLGDTERNITILGIGDFGKAVLDKLIKYQRECPKENFHSSFLHIKDVDQNIQLSLEPIKDDVVSNTEIVLIVGDMNDKHRLEICRNLASRFSGKLVVCLLRGIDSNFEIKGVQTMIQLNEDLEEAYLALRLFPDLIERQTLLRLDRSDVMECFKLNKRLKVIQVDFTKKELESEQKLIKNIPATKNCIFIIYGDNQIKILWIDRIAGKIQENSKSDDFFLFTAIVTAGKSDCIKAVILYEA